MSINRDIDRIADEFESAWQAGQSPGVADFANRVDIEHREKLLAVLIPLDITFQRQSDSVANVEDYAALGDHAIAIARRELEGRPSVFGDNELDDTLPTPFPQLNVAKTLPSPLPDGFDPTLTFMRLDETQDGGHESTPKTSAANQISPGVKINDRYLVEKEVGRGGMGEVYLGLDVHLQRKVAIKTIRSDLVSTSADSDAKKAAFEEEARIGAGLVHPAIATVYDYGFSGPVAYTVFEYVAGEPMRDFIRDRAPMPLEDVKQFVGVLAQALDYAHARGIVHRDLKPENIRLTEQGQPKILDLGLAIRFKNVNSWRFAGTPAYASPEQAAELPSDGRTDQYALALIVYEMLTKQRPFATKDWREILHLHRSETPKPVTDLRPDLRMPVSESIQRALRKDPNERHVSCEAFAAALGCQFQIAKSISDHILLQTTVVHRAIKELRWKFRILKGYPNRAILLETDRFWIDVGANLNCWPRDAMQLTKCVGKKISYVTKWGEHARNDTIYFETSDERILWQNELQARAKCSPAKVDSDWTPERRPPLLLLRKSNVPCQILGNLEAIRNSAKAAKSSLQLLAASQDSDAVVDFALERIPQVDRTKWRASGIAIKCVDFEGKLDLAVRWFGDRVTRLARLAFFLSFGFALFRGGVFFLASNNVDTYNARVRFGLVFVFAAFHLWPVIVSAMLWKSRIPQLTRATSVAFLSLAALPIVTFFVSAIKIILTSDYSETIAKSLFFLLYPESLLLVSVSIFIWRSTAKAYSEFKESTNFSSLKVSSGRFWIGRCGVSISWVYLLVIICYGAIQGNSMVRPLNLRSYQEIRTALADGDRERAKTLLREQSRQSPTPEAWTQLAALEFQSGNHEQCVECATKAISLNPKHCLALLVRYHGYSALGKTDLAFNDAATVLSIEPDNKTAIFAVAISNSVKALQSSNHQGCVDEATRAINAMPAQAQGYVNRAAGQINLGQFQKAVDDCDKAIEINPKIALAFVNRSSAKLNLDQFEEAIVDAEHALSLEPSNALANRNIAVIAKIKQAHSSAAAGDELREKEDYQAAIAEYSNAISGLPNWADPYAFRGYCYLQIDNFPNVISDCVSAIELGYDEEFNRTNLLTAYISNGDFTLAHQNATDWATKEPDSAEPHLILAQVYAHRHDVDKALGELAEHAKLSDNPSSATITTLMSLWRNAERIQQHGKSADATKLLQTSIEICEEIHEPLMPKLESPSYLAECLRRIAEQVAAT